MSYVMLPRSSRAIPQTNAERIALGGEPPLFDGNMAINDQPDEFGAEMAKEARVWKTYVKETDQSDKEMAEGRNNSLDVLLIFAALFSAISTAFVIESLSDLKPDPTDSSARTLLEISQTLAAMSNGQPVSLPAPGAMDPLSFSPSRTAILVNLLWFLSLSLSVAVSLIAMLAKEWCYMFMSRRSGPMYEQARRRQERWNGIVRWKMAEVLTYLPGVMHLALFLFAVGLSLYLWDINTGVALPVVVVTASATLAYISATVLPLIDVFCPYSTPAHKMIAAMSTSIVSLSTPIVGLCFPVVDRLYYKIDNPKWLESSLKRLRDKLNPNSDKSPPSYSAMDKQIFVDGVTTQMLHWLITNCEDSRSVDTALQAIAGAERELPLELLKDIGTVGTVLQRLATCFQGGQEAHQYRLKDPSLSTLALRYSRTLSRMTSDIANTPYWDLDSWEDSVHAASLGAGTFTGTYICSRALHTLIEYTESTSSSPSFVALTVATALPLCHWNPGRDLSDSDDTFAKRIVPALMTSSIQEYIRSGGAIISAVALHALVESSVYYLIGLYPRETLFTAQRGLPILLAQIYLTSGQFTLLKRTIATNLAAAAFATHPYPGGEESSQDTDAREHRAVKVLQYYRERESPEYTTISLFKFGFVGLLPRLDFSSLSEPETNTMSAALALGVGYNSDIHTLPSRFTHQHRIIQAVSRCLLSVVQSSLYLSGEKVMVSACLEILLPKQSETGQNTELYIAALVALCYAQSDELQEFCIEILNTQPVPESSSELISAMNNKQDPEPQIINEEDVDEPLNIKQHTILNRVYESSTSDDPHVARTVLLHLRLLVATMILSTDVPLDTRQSALKPLVERREFAELEPSIPDRSLPSAEQLYLHLQETIGSELTLPGESLVTTMQFVVDFCHATPTQQPAPSAPSQTINWVERLQALKDNCTLRPTPTEPGSATGVANPCWRNQPQTTEARAAPSQYRVDTGAEAVSEMNA